MKRRTLLAGMASALAAPAIGATTSTLTFVPQSPLSALDPIWTSAQTTRNLAFMIYDFLFGRDAAGKPKPQMVEGYTIEDDGKRWVMKLRPELWFHDGEKVRARDCAASVRRWMQRDPAGFTLQARLDAIETPDDRTIVFRLKKPLPSLTSLITKFQTPCIMVPERMAQTDGFKQMTETVGSGPFKFLPDEYLIYSHAAFARNDRYVPRNEPADFASGGHRVMVDRVHWKMIPDTATAGNALITGEVDWLEMPSPDLMSLLKAQPNIATGRVDDLGFISVLRPNHMAAPTNNAKLRRAIMAAVDQREVMAAMMGGDPDSAYTPMGYMFTGKPEVDNAGIEALTNRKNPAELKAMLADAGYSGERLVVLHPSDQPFYNPATQVVVDHLTRAGMNIDDQVMDWGTVVRRRISQEPLDKGGWSLFVTVTPVPEHVDPLLATLMRGSGKDAYIGWPTIPEMEEAYFTWLDTADPAEQTRLERKMQLIAFDQVPFIPLGRYAPRAAWSKRLSTPLKGPTPTFWNITKS